MLYKFGATQKAMFFVVTLFFVSLTQSTVFVAAKPLPFEALQAVDVPNITTLRATSAISASDIMPLPDTTAPPLQPISPDTLSALQEGQCYDYIKSGSFEEQATGDNTRWYLYPPGNATYSDVVTRTGSWSAYMTTKDLSLSKGESASWLQPVDIPEDVVSISLEFYSKPTMQDAGEKFYVTLWDENFTHRLSTTELTHETVGEWKHFAFDLLAGDVEAMNGELVNVSFQLVPDDDTDYSDLYLDDVIVKICTPAPQPKTYPANAVVVDETNVGQQVGLTESQYMVVELEANPSTGYQWEVVYDDGGSLQSAPPVVRQAAVVEFEEIQSVQSSATELEPLPEPVQGAAVRQILRFDPIQAGATTVTLAYRNSDSTSSRADEQTVSFNIQGIGSFGNANPLGIPTDVDSSLPIDDPLANEDGLSAGQNENVTLGLPTRFNWCDNGGCTPVKNQGSCGSCWAFATAGVMEINLKSKGGVTRDLSEQSLVSCDLDGYSCARGGNFAAKYYHNRQFSIGSGPGVVYESSFPYVAQDIACKTGLQHNEKIKSWYQSWSTPSVNQLKQAIQDHGPLFVAVCAGSAMSNWRNKTESDVFRTDEKRACDGGANHAVVLTGWDDAAQAFYMRNSWGTGWGNQGNAKIGYGVSNIGVMVGYVDYEASSSNVVIRDPSNVTASPTGDNKITIRWQDNSTGEESYKILRWNSSTSKWDVIATLAANSTAYADNPQTCNQRYYYHVQASHSSSSKVGNLVYATNSCGTIADPTNLVATGSTGRISLSWRDRSDNEDGFLIARWDTGSGKWSYPGYVTLNSTSWTDTSVNSNYYYYYLVIGYRKSGSSYSYSNWSNMTPGKRPQLSQSVELSAPNSATVKSTSKNSVTLNWSNTNSGRVSSRNAGNFVVERWNSTAGEWEKLGQVGASATSCVDKALTCDTSYYYMVYAANEYDNSNYSNMVEAKTSSCDAPDEPESQIAVCSGSGGSNTYLPVIIKNGN